MTDRRKDTIMGTFGDNSPRVRETITLFVPDGYTDAADFLKDCQFEHAPDELPSRSEMVSLVAAIIQDEAKYDPATNTWDVEKAAEDIVTAFENA